MSAPSIPFKSPELTERVVEKLKGGYRCPIQHVGIRDGEYATCCLNKNIYPHCEYRGQGTVMAKTLTSEYDEDVGEFVKVNSESECPICKYHAERD